jgi:hypothetical protein
MLFVNKDFLVGVSEMENRISFRERMERQIEAIKLQRAATASYRRSLFFKRKWEHFEKLQKSYPADRLGKFTDSQSSQIQNQVVVNIPAGASVVLVFE